MSLRRRRRIRTPLLRRTPRTDAEALEWIRRHLAALGHPVDHLTDAQLVAGVRRLADIASRAGIPAHVAAERMRRMGRP